MKLFLDDHIKSFMQAASPFTYLMNLSGDVFRSQENRITQRVQLADKTYFIKQHFGIGWKEIVKNLIQLKWPVISATNEWRAIDKLHSLNISAPKIFAYGRSGINPATMHSFILLEELSSVISLEELGKSWKTHPPTCAFKYQLIRTLAFIAKTIHQHGMNHRDFYLCHFLLDKSALNQKHFSHQALHVIDLHRAQIRRQTPTRWIIKDLAGLYFSSYDVGLRKRDFLRFIKAYRGKPLRHIFMDEHDFWLRIKKQGEKLL